MHGSSAAPPSYPRRLLHDELAKILDPRNTWQLALLPAKYAGALRAARFEADHLLDAEPCATRDALLADSVRRAPPEGLVLEFGVFRGTSINVIAAEAAARADPRVFGFDSFSGLPEDWVLGVARGSFRTGELPRVRENVTLVRGLFQETLEPFLAEHPGAAALVHVDSDLYSSCVYVLATLDRAHRLVPGTVIQFDEYVNYPRWWENGEYRAFQEFVKARRVGFRYLAYAAASQAVSVRIESLSGTT